MLGWGHASDLWRCPLPVSRCVTERLPGALFPAPGSCAAPSPAQAVKHLPRALGCPPQINCAVCGDIPAALQQLLWSRWSHKSSHQEPSHSEQHLQRPVSTPWLFGDVNLQRSPRLLLKVCFFLVPGLLPGLCGAVDPCIPVASALLVWCKDWRSILAYPGVPMLPAFGTKRGWRRTWVVLPCIPRLPIDYPRASMP